MDVVVVHITDRIARNDQQRSQAVNQISVCQNDTFWISGRPALKEALLLSTLIAVVTELQIFTKRIPKLVAVCN